jgi:hypothetical protein
VHHLNVLFPAFFTLDRYLKQRPNDASALHLFSLVCERFGHIELAIERMDRAIGLLEVAHEGNEDPTIERQFIIANTTVAWLRLTVQDDEGALNSFQNILRSATLAGQGGSQRRGLRGARPKRAPATLAGAPLGAVWTSCARSEMRVAGRQRDVAPLVQHLDHMPLETLVSCAPKAPLALPRVRHLLRWLRRGARQDTGIRTFRQRRIRRPSS